ncbi:GNAT family N-acetyltransferase [Nocardioides sp. zg-1228]|uniref:GNAT family N-acetyltransferase n=1 Tax=Nocardioides sp. zg-1228 TaxID=2763008 RepID=UPI001643583A|nr:GNAT family N-acetyltransferase [Nocardioides sp. zg-1228]MBC2935050.1 GNAT family N-acetyltransferase [Nocardioides sp. zg-1228]QSF58993.1 GNAT family N-acetyltransferase [Nocardioides sp. zg-1228]
MALVITPCASDEDLEAWRQVRIAVVPYERAQSVEEMRAHAGPDRLMVLAREDGVVVGSGLADRSETSGGGSVVPRVLPEHRRRGVGTALLDRLVAHVAGLGVPTLRAGADDEGSLAFAQRFGFEEVNREVEQTFRIDAPIAVAPAPDGIEVVTAQERPGLWEAAYDGLGLEALADFAVDTPLDVTPERWATSWLADPMFLALHDGEVVGCAGLGRDPDQPTRAENGLTAVRRAWRGRGLAVHLKQRALAWAADHGIHEVYTWTQDGNAAMRALNTRLGYATTRVGIQLARPLPPGEPPFTGALAQS